MKFYRLILLAALLNAGCSKPIPQAEPTQVAKPAEFTAENKVEPLALLVDQPCKPETGLLGRSTCAEGELCLPNPGEPKSGLCMLECSDRIDDHLVKNHKKCPESMRCVSHKSVHLQFVGNFCVTPQPDRNQPCAAPFDMDACANSMTCLPTISSTSQDGREIFGLYQCKNECLSDAQCSESTERCLRPKYARKEAQKDNKKPGPLMCSVKACLTNKADCPCDASLGFACTEMVDGLDQGACIRPLGVCGQPVSWANIKDFKDGQYSGETCNEITANRFCEDISPIELDDKAKVLCKMITGSGEGVCLAMCSMPEISHENNNEVITQSPPQLNCPKDYSCKFSVARELGMFRLITHKGQPKACDPTRCPPGQPCPSECGAGDAECGRVPSKDGILNVCGAPIGTCERD